MHDLRVGDMVFVKPYTESYRKYGSIVGVFLGFSRFDFSDVRVIFLDGTKITYAIPTRDLKVTPKQIHVISSTSFPVAEMSFKSNPSESWRFAGDGTFNPKRVHGICRNKLPLRHHIEHFLVYFVVRKADGRHFYTNYMIEASRVNHVDNVVCIAMLCQSNLQRPNENIQTKQTSPSHEGPFDLYEITAYNTEDGTIYFDTERVTARDRAIAEIKATRKLDETAINDEHLRIVVTRL